MKNAINYYYNLIVEDIHQKNKTYYFDYDNNRYYLVLYEGDPTILNDIYNLHLNLLQSGLYVHQIILNQENVIITLINGEPYVLLKTAYYEGKVDYNKMRSFLNLIVDKNLNIANNYIITNTKERNKNSLLERINWGDMWALKNDYLEYQISQLGQKYQTLRDSFSYYIGLGETGIGLVNTLPLNNIPKVISHRRIKTNDTLFELYNPLNFIIDSRVRDAAEYFKNTFFSGKDITNELNHFLTTTNLNQTEHLLFLARMLYPTYYFDLFEDIISGKKDEKEIKKITDLTSDYEHFLRRLYSYYKSIIKMNPIEWLDKY